MAGTVDRSSRLGNLVCRNQANRATVLEELVMMTSGPSQGASDHPIAIVDG
jgi:hypothetical protein